jgi:hypothetical protein
VSEIAAVPPGVCPVSHASVDTDRRCPHCGAPGEREVWTEAEIRSAVESEGFDGANWLIAALRQRRLDGQENPSEVCTDPQHVANPQHHYCQQRAEPDPSTERSEGQPNTAAIRAEHEAHNYRVSALSSPHDCDGCGAEDAAKWDVLWFNEDRDEEPFLCDDCLAREFREIRLCDALDAARAQVANAEARIDAVREAVDEFSAYGQISVDRILGALGGTDD